MRILNCSTITSKAQAPDNKRRPVPPAPPWPYDLGIQFYRTGLALASPLFPKAAAWLDGRHHLLHTIRQQRAALPARLIWMHCASLGEFEQGRPLLDQLRASMPETGLVLTFFSPSGYAIRKNYPGVDAVWYLPLDVKNQAGEFLEIVQPVAGIFVKYDLWLNHLHQAALRRIPLYLIAARFRPDQVFFKPWGRWHRNGLRCFQRIFCQDPESVKLLTTIGLGTDPESYPIVDQAPDTRFDRVLQIASSPQVPAPVQVFAKTHPVLVAGSTWPPDQELLGKLAVNALFAKGWKMIVAPHEIREEAMASLATSLPGKVLRYSTWEAEGFPISEGESAQILVVDRIGMLSALYSLGQAAYIGGGFGAGIHNTLEAAVYGIPLAFGHRYKKFREAEDLVEMSAAASVINGEQLLQWFLQLPQNGTSAGKKAADYVRAHQGGTAALLSAISQDLLPDS